MGLSLKDPETERRIRRLAESKGIGITAAIRLAVDNELAKEDDDRNAKIQRKMEAFEVFQARIAALPVLDPTANDDDWMYDENGLPR